MNNLHFESIEQMIGYGNYSEALSEIENLEKKSELSNDEQLTLIYLRAYYYLTIGLLKEGKEYSLKLIRSSRDLLNPIRELDGLISFGKAISKLGDPITGLEQVGKAKKILKMLSEKPSPELMRREADLLHLEGMLFHIRGTDDKALEMFQKSIKICEKIQDEIKSIDSIYRIGGIYYYSVRVEDCLEACQRMMQIGKAGNNKRAVALAYIGFSGVHRLNGEHEEAQRKIKEALSIAEDLNDQFLISTALKLTSTFYFDVGDLTKAIEYMNKWERVIHQTGDITEEIGINNNRGAVYSYTGDVDLALEHYQKSIEGLEKIGNQKGIIISLVNASEIFTMTGRAKTSWNYLERALDLARKSKFDLGHALALYSIIRDFNSSITLNALNEYLAELKEIHDRLMNYLPISQQYRLGKAIILKSKGRLADKMKAQTIFKEITEEKCVHLENMVEALINLSEILLFELETTGNKSALGELNEISIKLLKLAKTQYAYPYMTHAYLIQSKLKLIDLNIKESQELLSQAHFIAQEKGLKKLMQIILIEEESMTKLLQTWEKILDQKPSIRDIIKISRVEDVINSVVRNKAYINEVEVIAYADKALQIAKSWKT